MRYISSLKNPYQITTLHLIKQMSRWFFERKKGVNILFESDGLF